MIKKSFIENTLGIKTIDSGEFLTCDEATILNPGDKIISTEMIDENTGLPLINEVKISGFYSFILVGGAMIEKSTCHRLFIMPIRKYAQRKSKQG